MSIEDKARHDPTLEGHTGPVGAEHITAESARGGEIGKRRDLLTMLVAALLLTTVGVTVIVFWFA